MAYPLRSRFRTGDDAGDVHARRLHARDGARPRTARSCTPSTTTRLRRRLRRPGEHGAGRRPIDDMRRGAVAARPACDADDFARRRQPVGRSPVEATQVGAGRPFEPYLVRGLDDAFLGHTTFGLGDDGRRATAREREVWDARCARGRTSPSSTASIVPRRDNFGLRPCRPTSSSAGFYFEDGPFDPIPIERPRPADGQDRQLTVIGDPQGHGAARDGRASRPRSGRSPRRSPAAPARRSTTSTSRPASTRRRGRASSSRPSSRTGWRRSRSSRSLDDAVGSTSRSTG